MEGRRKDTSPRIEGMINLSWLKDFVSNFNFFLLECGNEKVTIYFFKFKFQYKNSPNSQRNFIQKYISKFSYELREKNKSRCLIIIFINVSHFKIFTFIFIIIIIIIYFFLLLLFFFCVHLSKILICKKKKENRNAQRNGDDAVTLSG